MKTLLAAITARRQPPPLPPARWEFLVERDQAQPLPQMRGPVDPWHDPCGRPPLPRGGPDD